jgi:hypothetical protein
MHSLWTTQQPRIFLLIMIVTQDFENHRCVQIKSVLLVRGDKVEFGR